MPHNNAFKKLYVLWDKIGLPEHGADYRINANYKDQSLTAIRQNMVDDRSMYEPTAKKWAYALSKQCESPTAKTMLLALREEHRIRQRDKHLIHFPYEKASLDQILNQLMDNSPSEPQKHSYVAPDEYMTNSEAAWFNVLRDAVNEKDFNTLFGLDYTDDQFTVTVPTTQPGPEFEVSKREKITLSQSSSAPQSEMDEIGTLLVYLKEAAENLLSGLDRTNAHRLLQDITKQYQKAISVEPLLIDLVYAKGLRVENAYWKFKADIENGEYPDLNLEAREAFDTLVNLHGVIIASTERGRKLLERANTYQYSGTKSKRYIEVTKKIVKVVQNDDEFIEDDAKEILTDLNEEFDTGKYPERMAALAHAANRNFLIRVAIVAMGVSGSAIIGSAIAVSAPGAELIETSASLVNFAWGFLKTNTPILRELIAISGADMTWLSALLDRVERPSVYVETSLKN